MVSLLTLACLLLSFYSGSVLAQLELVDGCLLDVLTGPNIAIELASESLVNNNGEGEQPVITVDSRFAICRAVGRTRYRFRTVTELVTFTAARTTGAVVFSAVIDFSCVATTNWRISIDGFRFTADDDERDLLQATELVTNCSSCSDVLVNIDNGDNVLQNCVHCHDDCLEEEQRLCYGNDENTCCNVYINDICMNECPMFQAPDPSNSSFECVCNIECLNGGMVNSDCSGCNCVDEDQFTGFFCEDPCDPNQCVNGACSPGAAPFPAFNCTCDLGFMGTLCDTPIDPCIPNRCVNGACSPGASFPDIICACDPGFMGTLCDTPIDPCDGVLCSNNGDCRAVDSLNFVCDCDPGFTGTNCETELNPCDSMPCQNLGTCFPETYPNFRCECRENFSGTLCETCDLPNCKTCSTTIAGECEDCFNGYLLTDGMCSIDCSICDQRETQCLKNTCNYYCLLNAWSADANTAGFTLPSFEEPLSTIPKVDQLNQIVEDAVTAEGAWNEIALPSIPGLQPPERAGITLSQWVSASEDWVGNLLSWLSHISTLDGFTDFPSRDSELRGLQERLASNPQGIYDQIIVIWREINIEYNRRLIAQG